MVDIAEKVRKARLRKREHIVRRYEGELVRDLMELRDHAENVGWRHCREDEGSKVEMVWTRDKNR